LSTGKHNKHRLTKLAEDRASIRDIEGIQTSIRNIQERLESAARAIADADIPEGIFRSEETEALLNFLAYHGRILYDAIITDQVDASCFPATSDESSLFAHMPKLSCRLNSSMKNPHLLLMLSCAQDQSKH